MDGDYPCRHCGYTGRKGPENLNILLPGTILYTKYRIGRALGKGGFGITYLAYDSDLEIKVAIKEYFPSGIVTRNESCVVPETRANSDVFEKGISYFLKEAQALAKLDSEPNIVRVRDYFRENDTAYFVMEFVDGQSMKEYLRQHGEKISFEKAKAILFPIMDALSAVHAHDMLHRDIAPDNIYITSLGIPKLLDFGAARSNFSKGSNSSMVVIKPGYAPNEQYSTAGNQGPWTDVYAMAATFYRALTGEIPPAAPDRLLDDPVELKRPADMGIVLPPYAENAIMKALSVRASDRFQTMADFKNALTVENGDNLSPLPPAGKKASGNGKSGKPSWKKISLLIALLAVLVAGGIFLVPKVLNRMTPLPPKPGAEATLELPTTAASDVPTELPTEVSTEPAAEETTEVTAVLVPAAAEDKRQEIVVGAEEPLNLLSQAVLMVKSGQDPVVIRIKGDLTETADFSLPLKKDIPSLRIEPYDPDGTVTINMNSNAIYAMGVPFIVGKGVTLKNTRIFGGARTDNGAQQTLERSSITIDGVVDNSVYGGGVAYGKGSVSDVKNAVVTINGTVAGYVYGGGCGHNNGGSANVSGTAKILLGKTGEIKEANYGGGIFGGGNALGSGSTADVANVLVEVYGKVNGYVVGGGWAQEKGKTHVNSVKSLLIGATAKITKDLIAGGRATMSGSVSSVDKAMTNIFGTVNWSVNAGGAANGGGESNMTSSTLNQKAGIIQGNVFAGPNAVEKGSLASLENAQITIQSVVAKSFWGGGSAYNGGKTVVSGQVSVNLTQDGTIGENVMYGGCADGSGSRSEAVGIEAILNGDCAGVQKEGAGWNGGISEMMAASAPTTANPLTLVSNIYSVGKNSLYHSFADAFAAISDGAGEIKIQLTSDLEEFSDVEIPLNKGITALTIESESSAARKVKGMSSSLFANGIPLTIAKDITLEAYTIYGGAKASDGVTKSVGDTNISIYGTAYTVFGGGLATGKGSFSTVNNTSVTIYGTVTSGAYGAGSAERGGTSSVTKKSMMTIAENAVIQKAASAGGSANGTGSAIEMQDADFIIAGTLEYFTFAGGTAQFDGRVSVNGTLTIDVRETGILKNGFDCGILASGSGAEGSVKNVEALFSGKAGYTINAAGNSQAGGSTLIEKAHLVLAESGVVTEGIWGIGYAGGTDSVCKIGDVLIEINGKTKSVQAGGVADDGGQAIATGTTVLYIGTQGIVTDNTSYTGYSTGSGSLCSQNNVGVLNEGSAGKIFDQAGNDAGGKGSLTQKLSEEEARAFMENWQND